jgi:hypothetical protein
MEKIKVLIRDSRKLRNKLVERMQELDAQEINCMNCSGVCCTKTRNSMMVTPLEAMDLYFYLIENIKDQTMLWKNVEQSITDYGLDREIYVKNKLMRKNYTCPLFKFESFGCPVEPHLKPFGCLGYNALGSNVKEGENCASDTELLAAVDQEIKEELESFNKAIKENCKIDFDKTNIPMALLKIKQLFS